MTAGRRSHSSFQVRDDRDLQELLAYVRTLQDREGELIESVRVLRRKYHACKAENRNLVWNKLSSSVITDLPPVNSNLEETCERELVVIRWARLVGEGRRPRSERVLIPNQV